MHKFKDKNNWFALGLLWTLFAFWAFLLTKKYFSFGYYDWDLAFFHQATWNILHGSAYSSLFDVNFFGNHSNLIVFLCLPLYALIQHPLTLVFLKLFSFFGGAYVLYLLAKEKLGAMLAVLLMFLYCFYSPNMFGLIYEFDYESLTSIFLFGLIYFFEKKLFKQFILTAVGLMLIKENMPFIVMTFSIYALFCRQRNRLIWALIPFALASAMFYILIYLFIPFCRGQGTHPYLGLYTQFGGSTPLGVIFNILTHPAQIFSFLTKSVNLNLLFELFGPLIYLPLLSPHILFLILPILSQHLLSASSTEHSIHYQYALSVSPFLYWGTVKALAFLKFRIRPSFFYFVISLMALVHLYSLNNSQADMKARMNIKKDSLSGFRWEAVKAIPERSAVIASFDFLAELSSRKDLYAFYKIHRGAYQDGANPFVVPEKVSYALIDFKDGWLLNDFYGAPEITAARIQKFFFSGAWSVEKAAEDIILFSKKEGPKLIEVSPSDKADLSTSLITVDHKFSLMSFKMDAESLRDGSLLPLTFLWEAREDIKERYELVLFLKKDAKLYMERCHGIGYLIYPTLVWKKGEAIKEHFWLAIPQLKEEGEYTLEMGFVDRSHNRIATPKTYPLANIFIQKR